MAPGVRLERPQVWDDLSPVPACNRRSAGLQRPANGILRDGLTEATKPSCHSTANISKLLINHEGCGLPWRPLQVAAPQQVYVQMKHGLPRARPYVEDGAVAILDATLPGNVSCGKMAMAD